MGLTQLLARYAVRRAHVLIVETPGYWVVRAAAERQLRSRGWCAATSPADADVLAVCGVPGPELAEAIGRVWDQLPGPRVRIDVPDLDVVDSVLDRAAVQLLDIRMHRNDARERAQSPDLSGGPDRAQHGEHQHMNHGAMQHGQHGQHGHMVHGSHEHMDHGDMEMTPAGIALAEGGEDRDGLEMDVLHVRLGPVFRYWPAGLVLRCSLQGDVLTQAEAWVVDNHAGNGNPPSQGRNDAAARQCDHVVDLLALAGWLHAAAIARTARDALLGEPDVARGTSLLDTLHGKLRRSRVLRWSLRDVASLTAEDCDLLGLPTALAGDCYDRLLTRVDLARQMLPETMAPNDLHEPSTRIVDAVPHLVNGLDLATARLVIASLGIDIAPAGDRHG
ncbi:hypothetical protein LFT51_10640 [Mycobacterium intracellulare subsp. chimaera]|uniref:hypothetical protein n=2 Tax=Mycobacterium intracellulare TaxID=1767 RepID=UPI00044A95CF|nr:hypothetical protein [Mycobacterium intracellulare]ETZ36765.1 hypothetical protein L842_6207 [Mycobacterium intracellulare MIN_052511_1280]ARV81685.1 hypothetical protein BWK49_10615 [Mycobacterium intracellulare subsp. chimaera]ASL08773.1 hypothetical protein MYCODSM44623_02035 [Mycobacterium intracellulare subsp. chimaera]ASL20557.1 hypothetical protein MYCOZU1_02127 [Mycobacterium intracellulare subsp. chimaera]MCV7323299.1 hypothetical protein [Mycobacterium intracellulare subsp. chimae